MLTIPFLMIFAAVDPALGIVVSALVGALATYLVAARNLSGKIRHTEATELWAESRSIREWSQKRADDLAAHVERLEARLVEVEKANTVLASENRKMVRELNEAHIKIIELTAETTALQGLLKHANAEVEHWKAMAENSPRRRSSDSTTRVEGQTE